MRTPSRHHAEHSVVLSALALCLSVALLSGCTATPTPTVTAPATTAATPRANTEPAEASPVFASNDEALAAAEAAYSAYEALSDTITSEGGIGGDRIAIAASAAYLPELLAGFEGFSETGLISRGTTTYDEASLIRSAPEPQGGVRIELYLCSDISAVRLYDASGNDKTPVDRTNRIPLQVGFVSSATEPFLLLIDKEDVWSGRNFCQ
ncbi:hypothetical protein [Cryobacterium sp. PH29-G1]|uniref:hypothetical protein n=1 Tax=Cryobacterium sp. PH29-G1 TaxID=3046211 RepID=UPI0024B939B6|nr:hypothetical protein [Cryobacterium sp. PH29-G1]MDJ0348582.1 hypothetical protein [Cryobacterium sp. PH29-G1]